MGWNHSGYNPANVYNRASVFPGFSCGVDGARVTGDYYFDDIAFNGAVTPKLAPTAKITSPSKKVIAVTVANAPVQTVLLKPSDPHNYKQSANLWWGVCIVETK